MRFLAAVQVLLLAAALLLPGLARADTRAWLDRDRIASDETVTLNIESDDPDADAAPDYAPLERDFTVSNHASSRRFERVNGGSRTRVLYAVALQPRRSGTLQIPALTVGGARTQPLTLTVVPAATAPARAGDPVFIETELDDEDPYLEQTVGFVVRLYYATPLISGQLDQPEPDGAALQRVGGDLQYERTLGNRRYNVVERRYLLTPERSGALTVPGARFRGRGVGGFFDDLFGDGQRNLAADAAPRFLQVRPIPANAPQPWLPLHGLRLRYVAAPQAATAGEAASVVVEAIADGGNAAQMPELTLPAAAGMQVFAEPPQIDETFDNGRPQVKVTRRFSIVPARAGSLRVRGPRLDWWDVRASAPRTARLPDLTLQVAPGIAEDLDPAAVSPGAAPAEADDGERWVRLPGVQGEVRLWAAATVAFALLWLLTLAWGLHRRAQLAGGAQAASARDAEAQARAAAARARSLRQALERGDLDDIAAALCAQAAPPAQDLDAVHARLADPQQQAAVRELQRARWGGGDPAAARAALRAAFARGPRWRPPAAAPASLLPPLYPERR